MALDSHRRFEILDFEKAFKHLEESCLKERKKETKKKKKKKLYSIRCVLKTYR